MNEEGRPNRSIKGVNNLRYNIGDQVIVKRNAITAGMDHKTLYEEECGFDGVVLEIKKGKDTVKIMQPNNKKPQHYSSRDVFLLKRSPKYFEEFNHIADIAETIGKIDLTKEINKELIRYKRKLKEAIAITETIYKTLTGAVNETRKENTEYKHQIEFLSDKIKELELIDQELPGTHPITKPEAITPTSKKIENK
jgi:hypothetical protein